MRTTATEKLLNLKKKIRAISGGTGASKTYSILMILCDYAGSLKNQMIDVVSESFPHLEAGAIADFKKIMNEQNYWEDNSWNETKHFYTFPTGSVIHFTSMDKMGKAHGPRRDVLFINECNYIPYNIVDQLITRTRKVVWLDWNPVSEFWFYTEMQGKRDDIDFMKLTYLDNEALSSEETKEIEMHKGNPNWWRVYGEGELGIAEGRVYAGWQFIDEIPFEARLEGYGLDFGYYPDPCAIVAVYKFNDSFILDEILYNRGVKNPELAATLKNLPSGLVTADSAEPKSIDELRTFGINIVGAEKGPDSVRFGVKTLQGLKISVTKRSLNLIKEYRNYFQKLDRRTNTYVIGEYEGENHLLDAARYKICSLIPILNRKEMIAHLPKFPPKQKTQIAL